MTINKNKNIPLFKKLILLCFDILGMVLGGFIAAYIASQSSSYTVTNDICVLTVAIGCLIAIILLISFGIYSFILRFTGINFVMRLMIVFVLTFIIQTIIIGVFYRDWKFAMILSVIQQLLSGYFLCLSRLCYQHIISYKQKRKSLELNISAIDEVRLFLSPQSISKRSRGSRILIVGAGWTGSKIVSQLSGKTDKYYPVCFVDDDINKQHLKIDDVPVVGTCDTLEENIEKYHIEKVIFAIPSASKEFRKTIAARCIDFNIEISILPDLAELIEKHDNIPSLVRPVNIVDLLERDEIKFDDDLVSSFIKDNVCMITGGGGSIGSELCRQIAKFSPKKIIICDIYENNAFDIAMELKEKGYPQNLFQVEIVSFADRASMENIFIKEKIDIIFNAAAHKHVPLMEHNPCQAIRNNVVGTFNVSELAVKYKVKKFIQVSTDKAVNPTNVMGATKRFCEKIVGYFGNIQDQTVFACVRFGNVLGSNGSVVHIFNKQIDAGGPIKVTHPDIIRYFMTIPEAVSLILQAGTFANKSEVFVLDMGEPIRIVKLAENMIRIAGFEPYEDIAIEFTGLRPGEKLFEELLTKEEGLIKTDNNKIFIGQQSYKTSENLIKNYELLTKTMDSEDPELMKEILAKVIKTYKQDKTEHKDLL